MELTTNTDAATVEALLAEKTPDAAAGLRAIAETTSDKATRKAAKRALYLLSQQGITPPETLPTLPTVSRTDLIQRELRAWASACDGAGNRLLFLTWPDPDGGSPSFLQTLLNDEEGVRDIDTRRILRRELAERLEGFEAQLDGGIALAEIAPDYGRWLLHQARTLNQQRRRRTPPGFVELLHVIGEPKPDYVPETVWDAISPETVQTDTELSRDPADLFKLPWFESWFLDVNAVVPWLDSLYAVLGQTGITEEEQKQGLDDTARQSAAVLLSGDTAARYIHRLEDAADILRRRGREAQARQTLYHAHDLKTATSAGDVAFAVLLVQRTLQAAIEMTRARTPAA